MLSMIIFCTSIWSRSIEELKRITAVLMLDE